MSVSLSPEAVQALIALSAALTPATPATPAVSGQPAAMAAFWASDYPGKGVAHHQLANGRWADVKGAICKAPTAAAPKAKPAAAPKVEAPKAATPTYTIAHFAEEHPEVMADLKAAILGTVFTAGGSWGEFRTAVLGR